MAVPEPMLTEFCIHHRLDSWAKNTLFYYDLNAKGGGGLCPTLLSTHEKVVRKGMGRKSEKRDC